MGHWVSGKINYVGGGILIKNVLFTVKKHTIWNMNSPLALKNYGELPIEQTMI